MKLCIAEKPSVARDIAKVLGATTPKNGYMEGNGYWVTWTFGHLCTLKEPHDYAPEYKAWNLFLLPIIPKNFGIKLINNNGVERQFKVIETLVKEIEYELNGKKYFGIGFFNNSRGVEIRNKYSKICLGKKDVTLIKNELNVSNEIIIFEGFFDYLTYKNLEKKGNSNSDYLILNSTAMLFKVEETLKKYDKISLFLDNDKNGNATKKAILKKYENVEDCSLIYRGFKDLNEWFCSKEDL
jgi:DNA topoisomerase IA